TSNMPVRVGFKPTFKRVILLPGTNAAATKKNAAEEISPGIVICCPCRTGLGLTLTVKSLVIICAPNELNIFSVCSRVNDFSVKYDVFAVIKLEKYNDTLTS